MRISNCVKNEDGSLDFDFHVDNNEAAYLMDIAVKFLMNQGLLNIEVGEAEQELALHMEDGGSIQ